MQSIEVILACSHKISRKGRYRKASERILTEKGEEKVDVTLYIKAGFRIGFLLFLLSAAWQDLRKKASGIYFLHLGNDGTDVSGYTDPLQTAADGLRRNRKKRGRDILVYGSPGFGTVP